MAAAPFTYRWEPSTEVGKMLQEDSATRSAEATLRRFDDGWRLQSLNLMGDQVRLRNIDQAANEAANREALLQQKGQQLIQAAGEGDLAKVQTLLAEGTDVNSRASSDGWTPVFWAAQNCHIPILRFLIQRGADLNVKDQRAYTAVSLPQTCEEAKKILQAAGAKMPVERPPVAEGWRCATPPEDQMHAASQASSDLCVQALNGRAVIWAKAKPRECRDTEGRTPLMIFAAAGAFFFVSDIAQAGVDVNAKDVRGCTALMYAEDALRHATKEPDLKALQDTIERLRSVGAR